MSHLVVNLALSAWRDFRASRRSSFVRFTNPPLSKRCTSEITVATCDYSSSHHLLRSTRGYFVAVKVHSS